MDDYRFKVYPPAKKDEVESAGTIELADGTRLHLMLRPDSGIVVAFPKDKFVPIFKREMENDDDYIRVMFSNVELAAFLRGIEHIDSEEHEDQGTD